VNGMCGMSRGLFVLGVMYIGGPLELLCMSHRVHSLVPPDCLGVRAEVWRNRLRYLDFSVG
jgi:hypothetical protein